MTFSSQNPVVVTGCHRGGTTWVGDTIAAHEALHYIYEPLKPMRPTPGRSIYKTKVWYEFQETGKSHAGLERQYAHTLNNRLSFTDFMATRLERSNASALGKPKALIGALRDFLLELSASRGKTACVKDPFALLHTGWLATTRPDVRIVIMVRHPAAFAFSLRRKGWHFPFESFLAQPDLLKAMPEYSSAIEQLTQEPADILEQASLLWGVLFAYVMKLPKMNNIYIVKYEDIAEDPEAEFGKIFSWLGLDMSREIATKIAMDTSGSNADGYGRVKSRDSKLNAWSWKKDITAHENDLTLMHCAVPLAHFYP